MPRATRQQTDDECEKPQQPEGDDQAQACAPEHRDGGAEGCQADQPFSQADPDESTDCEETSGCCRDGRPRHDASQDHDRETREQPDGASGTAETPGSAADDEDGRRQEAQRSLRALR